MAHRLNLGFLASFLSAAAMLTACGTNPDQVGGSQTRSSNRDLHFTVSSYNAENIWDEVDGNSVAYTDFADKTSNWLKDKMFARKGQILIDVLRAAGSPDIVGLQEIESGGNESHSLELIKNELAELGYHYLALGKQAEPTAVTTAVISKFPIVENRSLLFSGDESSRDPQVVTVDVQGKRLTVYVNHWKSARGDAPKETEEQRMAAAKLVRDDLNNLLAKNPATDAIVLGDFNSDYNSNVAFDMKTGLIDVLKASGNLVDILSRKTDKLYNLWFDMPVDERCTVNFEDRRRCLDNMLLTDTLFDNSGVQYVPGSFRVFGKGNSAEEKMMINANGAPFRWQTKLTKRNKEVTFTKHVGVGVSDHLPLVGEFVVTAKNDAATKISVPNASSTEFGPKESPALKPLLCKGELTEDLLKTDFSDNQAFKKCVALTKGNLKIKMLTDHDIGVEINGVDVMITANAPLTRHKDLLRGTIQKQKGKHLDAIVGRVGWDYGYPAIFIDSADDIKIR